MSVYSIYSLDQTTKGFRYIGSLEYRINRYKSTKQICTWSVLDVYMNILLVDVSKGVHGLREKHDEMRRSGLPNNAESCKIAKSLQPLVCT